MAIQWFPGHMHTTRLAMVERLKSGIDVVIELLDARLPGSSANPLLAELTAGKPALKLLNKQDLADPARTTLWLDHYNAQPGTRAIGLDASEPAPAARLVTACRAMAPLRGGMVKPLRLLICGIPNVGKSTLINTLVRRKAAKTGDEAGITKTEQVIVLASDVTLFDTPGMLWPRITVPQSGYLLAASGAIGRNAYDEHEVALVLLEALQASYAAAIATRYKLPDAAALAAMPADALLELIARQRGLVQTGGRLNLQKAAEVVLNDFRSGAMGRVTLETPEEHAQWVAEGQAREAARAAKKKGRGKSRDAAPLDDPEHP
ncbi:ribosome biogenesis GTPase YlqF [Ideonella sp. A 288]|uniref:ribosome biogenesis GTPase YlqF n=1 Tax=Ideonella sp. A 288 TaxID=1962181 RepID=UPI000B4BD3AF|nr:ribosome biogenesis GTPase YlqF [Ideonella sp. A 288]